MLTAEEAIGRLREGNGRFVDGGRVLKDLTSHERRSEVSDRQEPFAIVLGCADARVPAEIVFDHGLGDLFVIRVAGNVVTPSGVGSVEFAAERFGTRLVVVLGHSRCGAVAATLEELERPTENPRPTSAPLWTASAPPWNRCWPTAPRSTWSHCCKRRCAQTSPLRLSNCERARPSSSRVSARTACGWWAQSIVWSRGRYCFTMMTCGLWSNHTLFDRTNSAQSRAYARASSAVSMPSAW